MSKVGPLHAGDLIWFFAFGFVGLPVGSHPDRDVVLVFGGKNIIGYGQKLYIGNLTANFFHGFTLGTLFP